MINDCCIIIISVSIRLFVFSQSERSRPPLWINYKNFYMFIKNFRYSTIILSFKSVTLSKLKIYLFNFWKIIFGEKKGGHLNGLFLHHFLPAVQGQNLTIILSDSYWDIFMDFLNLSFFDMHISHDLILHWFYHWTLYMQP